MFSMTLPKRDERGFTLIELLVVIIVIGILAAIAIPLFLDQRKLAVDASVKSDVRNTATQVQTWQATNPGLVAADATAYTAAGGKVVATGTNTVGVAVATDGSYLVCGYVNNAKTYTGANAAYVFDSSTGRFGTGTCTGGIVGGGTSSTPAPSTSTPTSTPTPTQTPPVLTSTTLPAGNPYADYSAQLTATGTPTPTYAFTSPQAGWTLSSTGALRGTLPASGTVSLPITLTSGSLTATGTATISVGTNLLTNASFESSTYNAQVAVSPDAGGQQAPGWWWAKNPNTDSSTRYWAAGTDNGAGGTVSPHSGSLMMGYWPGSVASGSSVIQDMSATITSGTKYTMGFWVRTQNPNTTSSVIAQLWTVNASPYNNCNFVRQTVPVTGTWTYVELSGTSSCSGNFLRYQLEPSTSSPATSVYDDMSVVKN
jgi:type IV pilus assembly protein PilA